MPVTRLSAEMLRAQAAEIAGAAGLADAPAEQFAHCLVDADLGGTATHGLSRLAIYVMGVAVATVRNSQHFGAAGYYTNLAAERGMILLAMSSVEPSMSPTGGADAFFGTNPIAAGFPTGKGWPVKVDLATSVVARGNIIAAQKRGEPIPEGWATDRQGRQTTDASAALMGTIKTMAGHKGYALAMMVESFSSVLSGSAVGPAVGSMYKDLDRKQDVGHFFALIDVEAFMPLGEFTERMDGAIDTLKAGRVAPGAEEILIPGERSHRTRQRNGREGVPLDDATVRELSALCDELGVEDRLRAGAAD